MATARPATSPSLFRQPETRCAIYTRKSTEDGLEQEFNSLDAQREACAAYVLSQRHEGWTLNAAVYDDGGYSGGNMERPALRQLLADVAAGRIDVIVVYKIDRLTRSLSDFARMVEILDRANASFVSITQAFNTTTSMGRLTLNILLSFAQFEREVTGERIRDKVAASKKKGMWMGGSPPLGYDVIERKLAVNETEAAAVRAIYARYLELGTIVTLQADLTDRGIYSKQWISRSGLERGGVLFTHGALVHLLSNRTYIGLVHHQGEYYPGEHAAILSQELFDKAQIQLGQNRVDRKCGTNIIDPSLLAGLLYDGVGRRMQPSSAAKQSRRYRYYKSKADCASDHPTWRIPAGELEAAVIGSLRTKLQDPGLVHQLLEMGMDDNISIPHVQRSLSGLATTLTDGVPCEKRAVLLKLLDRVDLRDEGIDLAINIASLLPSSTNGAAMVQLLAISTPAHLIRAGKEVRLAIPPSHSHASARHDSALIKLIVKSHGARAMLKSMPETPLDDIAQAYGVTRDYFRVLIRLSFLAPDITSAILEGRQPATLTRQLLARFPDLPIEWAAQREALGFC